MDRFIPILASMSPSPVHRATDLLIRYLERRELAGQRRALLSPEARAGLRSLYFHLRRPRSSVPVSAAVTRGPVPSSPAPAAFPSEPPQASVPVSAAVTRGPVPSSPDPAAFPEAPVAEARAVVRPEGATVEERIEDLKNRIAGDAEARAETLRDTMVFSVGDVKADLMFIGEAPGHEEERRGEPFVGPAGQLLTKIIQAMGLSRESVYISNIVKYRPAMPNQGTRNRKPTPEEMRACLPYILAEIEEVRPRAIVAAGATAAEGLMGTPSSVGRERGRVRLWKGIPFVVTYHPSYLLHNQAPSERRKVWEDMLLVMEVLNLPISDKQRGYFASRS